MEISKNSKLSFPVQSHADLQLAVLGGKRVLIGKGEKALRKSLEEHGFQVIESNTELGSIYPQEALLDFVSLGDRIIGNSKIIGNNYLLNNSQFIHVNQGYTKCNFAMVNDHAAMTSDETIAAVCQSNGFDVLKIRQGFIELPGYSYGFIGGCCGLIAADRLAVCGELNTHPDCDMIKQFLYKHHITAVELCAGALRDIGGVIPLKQNRKS